MPMMLLGVAMLATPAMAAPSATPSAAPHAKPSSQAVPRPPVPQPPGGPEAPIAVFVNGQKVKFDVPPVMQNGAVFVPLRGVFEKMKATVDYNHDKNLITAEREGVKIEVRIGDRFAKVNGENVVMMTPAGLVHNRAFVPLRFLSEQLGMDVDWNPARATVNIKSHD